MSPPTPPTCLFWCDRREIERGSHTGHGENEAAKPRDSVLLVSVNILCTDVIRTKVGAFTMNNIASFISVNNSKL